MPVLAWTRVLGLAPRVEPSSFKAGLSRVTLGFLFYQKAKRAYVEERDTHTWRKDRYARHKGPHARREGRYAQGASSGPDGGAQLQRLERWPVGLDERRRAGLVDIVAVEGDRLQARPHGQGKRSGALVPNPTLVEIELL